MLPAADITDRCSAVAVPFAVLWQILEVYNVFIHNTLEEPL